MWAQLLATLYLLVSVMAVLALACLAWERYRATKP